MDRGKGKKGTKGKRSAKKTELPEETFPEPWVFTGQGLARKCKAAVKSYRETSPPLKRSEEDLTAKETDPVGLDDHWSSSGSSWKGSSPDKSDEEISETSSTTSTTRRQRQSAKVKRSTTPSQLVDWTKGRKSKSGKGFSGKTGKTSPGEGKGRLGSSIPAEPHIVVPRTSKSIDVSTARGDAGPSASSSFSAPVSTPTKSGESSTSSVTNPETIGRGVAGPSTTTTHQLVSAVNVANQFGDAAITKPIPVFLLPPLTVTASSGTSGVYLGLSSNKDNPLPKPWLKTLPAEDHFWVSRALFHSNGKLRDNVTPWTFPPQPAPMYSAPPSPSHFFGHRFFLWLPCKMWGIKYTCVKVGCGGNMTKAGLYKTVRRVVDMRDDYFMATEYLECSKCHKKLAAWSKVFLDQTDPGHRYIFPALMSYHLAIDKKVLSLLRDRGVGNACGLFQRKLLEVHSEHYLEQKLQYLSAVGNTLKAVADPSSVEPAPTFLGMPKSKWFQHLWAADVFNRLEELKAKLTAVFGTILKIDSTKKVTKKLAGSAAGTAAWVTNVGNELGQVLISVVTAAEGGGLRRMTQGLETRFRSAGVPPPAILYVDRDCCGTFNRKAATLFPTWTQTAIRLDIWHFMRRLAACVTTESHPLYAPFMARLSACIYVWDATDVERLRHAIAEECRTSGRSSSEPTKKELAKHCRRATRGAEQSKNLINQLLEILMGDGGTDTMGVPLLNGEKMREAWKQQQGHLPCIQDPPGVQLYKQTGTIRKAGVQLPVYRCHRGTTSLESFHKHLNQFLPAESYSDVNFQAYLLEGLVRWNQDREVADRGTVLQLRTYDQSLQLDVIAAAQRVQQDPGVHVEPAAPYSGELIGMEYLLSQNNEPVDHWQRLLDRIERGDAPEEEEEEEEEEDSEDLTATIGPMWQQTSSSRQSTRPMLASLDDILSTQMTDTPSTVTAESTSSAHTQEDRPLSVAPDASTSSTVHNESPTSTGGPSQTTSSTQNLPTADDEDFTGPDGQIGYERVVRLASYLVSLRDAKSLSTSQVAEIVKLFEALAEQDKKRVQYLPRHKAFQTKGRFGRSKSAAVPGVESVQRGFRGADSSAAQRPDASRLVEAIVDELANLHPSGGRGQRNRWAGVMKDYRNIRRVVTSNKPVMAQTALQLFEINNKTLHDWDQRKRRTMERTILLQGVDLPDPELTTHGLPAPVTSEQKQGHATVSHDIAPSECRPKHHTETLTQTGQVIRVSHTGEMHHVADMVSPYVPPPQPSQLPPIAPKQELDVQTPKVPILVLPPLPPSCSSGWSQVVARTQKRVRVKEQDRVYKKKKLFNTCRACGQPKIKETGHKGFKGYSFCPMSGDTYEQFLEAVGRKRAEKAEKK